MKWFCTLFDSRYLSRALAMYESLTRTTPDSHVFFFPFDEVALNVLRTLNLKNATVVPMADFEDEMLLQVKGARSQAEYCWTCTPSIVNYCIRTFNLDGCTYVDADLYFFSDTRRLFDEIGAADAAIIEHRYTPRHDRTATAGIYNVQFMPFRSTDNGMRILEWWRNACLEACELSPEKGLWADQMYLNDWPERFNGVHVLRHLGGGVAPWNVQQYSFRKIPGGIGGVRIADNQSFDLVFYHFHALKMLSDSTVEPTDLGYVFDRSTMKLLYAPYIAHLSSVADRLRARFGSEYDFHGLRPAPFRSMASAFRQKLASTVKGNANIRIPSVKASRIASIDLSQLRAF